MDRILIILKKENGPRASSAPALGLNTIIFKYVYWYMKQISGERLQDHWSSGLGLIFPPNCHNINDTVAINNMNTFICTPGLDENSLVSPLQLLVKIQDLILCCLLTTYEPRREKTGLRGFRPGLTQTDLYKLRKEPEA